MNSRHPGTRPRTQRGPAFILMGMAIATLLHGSLAAADVVVDWNEIAQWTRFSRGVAEVVDARISGIHFRTADVRGAVMGAWVAQVVVRDAIRPERRDHGEE